MSGLIYEFGHFRFDAQRRALSRDGVPVRLSNKALEVLALLLREAGKPVSKERMHETIWGNSFVDDANLTQTIYVLRKTLSNGSPDRAIIRTIPKLGYEFVEPLRINVPSPPPRRAPLWPGALAACALLAALTVVYFAASRPQTSSADALLPTAALKAYGIGREAWINPTRASGFRARTQFERVVRLAPRNPLGYAGLSDAYLLISGQTPPGKERRRLCAVAAAYARRALSLDPNSSEAHASNAQSLYYHKLPGAQAEFEKAVALNPKNALAHRWFGEFWLMRGNFPAAAGELALSNALQPPIAQDLFWLGVAQYYAHRFREATQSFRETIAVGGSDPEIGLHLALAYDANGDAPAALHELNALQRAHPDSADVHVVRASVLGSHHPVAALKEIARALQSNSAGVSAFSVAIALARAGKLDEARTWLREHRVWSDETSIFPRYDPRLAGLQLYPPRRPTV